jgi:hypothetical protein
MLEHEMAGSCSANAQSRPHSWRHTLLGGEEVACIKDSTNAAAVGLQREHQSKNNMTTMKPSAVTSLGEATAA